jgi:PucR C-terminal helix-turn-helix domain/GGDEF-like domain
MSTAGIAVAALLGHPDWSSVVVLAGPPESDNPVHGVLVVPDVLSEPRGAAGQLLAVVLSAPRADWHLDALLRRADAEGAAAVLLPGTEALQPASLALAERIGLPVLGAPDPLAATMAATRLIHEQDRVVADLVTRTAATCADAGQGTDALVADLGRLWRRPVWLLDAAGRVVAGPEPGPEQVPDAEPGRGAEPGRRAELVERALGPRGRGARLAAAVPAGVPAEVAAITAALGVAVESVGQRLAEQRLAVERDARLRMALLAEIAQSSGELSSGTRRRAIDAGWQIDGWHVGIRIDVPGAVDPVAIRPEVLRAVTTAHLRAVVVEQGSGWGAWSTFDHAPSPAELQRHASAARRVQWLLRSSLPTSMGVGRAHNGVPGLVRTLSEAGDAARLATGRSTSGHYVHVDRMGLGQMLLAWTRTDTFLPAARSLLEPLDGQPGELLLTLTAFLDAESSLTETAAVLGVHRNTVAARITRIRELLAVDLADPDERLALHLACRSVVFHR